MKSSEAIDIVDAMCGGDEGFHRAWRFIGEDWDKNLEDFCLQRQAPEEYVERCKKMHDAYKLSKFNNRFDNRLVNGRGKK